MELVALRDKFANRLSHQVNGMVVRFCSQLMRIAPGGGSGGGSRDSGGSVVGGSMLDVSGGGGASSKHHRLHHHIGGSIMNLSGSKSNLTVGGGGGASNSGALTHCYELLKVQRSEMLQLSSLVGGWMQVNRPDVFRILKKVGSWFFPLLEVRFTVYAC